MTTVQAILLILQTLSVTAIAGMMWHIQLSGLPMLIRCGRSRFKVVFQYQRAVNAVLVAPLAIVDAVTLFWLTVDPPLCLAGYELTAAATIWVLLVSHWVFMHRRHSKRLKSALDPRILRKLILGFWAQTFGWSFRAAAAVLLVAKVLRMIIV
jgi:hypothetical protein